jgi:ABC-2 type transport system permease protein
MIERIFFYRLKTILRDKEMVFWTIFFPILLASLFRIAFANLGQVTEIFPIPTAVVDNDAFQADSAFREMLTAVSNDSGETGAVLDLSRVSREEAEALLLAGSIYGFIVPGVEMQLIVDESGLHQSILGLLLDQYLQSSSTAGTVISRNPAAAEDFIRELELRTSYIRTEALGKNNPDRLFVFYFALLAMACFYGGYYGLVEAFDIQGNLSPRAARINMSPIHKLKALLASSSAAVFIHLCSQMVLLAFMHVVLKVRFGAQLPLVIFATLVGSTLSIALGIFIGTVVRGSENFKNGMVTAVSMIGALFAGLMLPELKYIVSERFPLINRINPVNLLADAYYALYFFEGFRRYSQNLLILLLFTVFFTAASYFFMRRRNYDSL